MQRGVTVDPSFSGWLGSVSGSTPSTSVLDDGSLTTSGGIDNGQVWFAVGENGSVSLYDSLGNAISDGSSLPSRITAPSGATLATLGYDAEDRVVSISDGAGDTTRVAYDAGGRVVQVTDPLGLTTRYAYDARNRLTAVTEPDGGTTGLGYDPAGGLLDSITDPLGNTTTTSYDSAGNLLRARDAIGRETVVEYLEGNPDCPLQVQTTDPRGLVTTYCYDQHDRLVSVTDGDGARLQRYTYDSGGDVLTSTDALGHTTRFTYDSSGDLNAVTDPLGITTHYTYDAGGDVLSASDGLGNTATYAYDSSGDLVTSTDALGRTTTYDYLAGGPPPQLPESPSVVALAGLGALVMVAVAARQAARRRRAVL